MTQTSGEATPIHSRMKEAREAAGLSQETVAFVLGVTQPTYSRMETGCHTVRLVHLIRFATRLGATVAALFPDYQPTAEERELLAHARRAPRPQAA